MYILTFVILPFVLKGLPSLAEPIPDALAIAEAYTDPFTDDFILSKRDLLLEDEYPALFERDLFFEDHASILSQRDMFFEDESSATLQERDQFFLEDITYPTLSARDLHRRLKNKLNLKINPAEINAKAPARFDDRYGHIGSGGSPTVKMGPSTGPPADKKEYRKGMTGYTAQMLKQAKDTGRPVKDPSEYRHGPTKSAFHKDYFSGRRGFEVYQDGGSSGGSAKSDDRTPFFSDDKVYAARHYYP